MDADIADSPCPIPLAVLLAADKGPRSPRARGAVLIFLLPAVPCSCRFKINAVKFAAAEAPAPPSVRFAAPAFFAVTVNAKLLAETFDAEIV